MDKARVIMGHCWSGRQPCRKTRPSLYTQSSKLFHKTGVATERRIKESDYMGKPEASDQNRARQ